MSLCILEGVDGAGKTTLAEYLCQRYKAMYFHDGPPNNPEYALSELTDDLAQHPERSVFDRFHLGNFAYGTVFRGSSDLSTFEMELLDEMLNKRGAALILCQPPEEQIEKNMRQRRKEGIIDPRGFEDSWEKSKRIMELMRLGFTCSDVHHKTTYDYTYSTPEDIGLWLEAVLEWE